VENDANLIKQLRGSLRPIIHDDVKEAEKIPESFIKLMKDCWQMPPNKRPTFSKIVDYISPIIAEFKVDKKVDAERRTNLHTKLKSINVKSSVNESWQHICDAFLLFDYDVEILTLSITALANLAKASDDNVEDLMKRGACDLFLSSMKKFPKDTNLQEWGLVAITLLSTGAKNRESIGALGATERVVEALDTHLSHDGVCKHALSAIAILALCEKNSTIFVNNDGLNKIVKVMSQHSGKNSVLNKAAEALCAICSKHRNYSQLVVQVGGKTALENAIKAFPDDHKLSRNVHAALVNLK